jgi:hypothetical protein
MSTDPTSAQAAAGAPNEEELRAAYEAELSRITTTDMLAQSAVSLLNLGARRLGPMGPPEGAGAEGAPGRDLEQARDAIDGARALLEILERRIPQELRPLRDALSQLQMAYARELQSEAPGPAAQPDAPAQGPAADVAQERPAPPPPPAGKDAKPEQPAPGPAESSGRLWVPGR